MPAECCKAGIDVANHGAESFNVKESNVTAIQAIARTLSPRARAGHNVLCGDADDHARLLIAELLYEHDVDFALTADDAVQLAHCRSYQLCFIDPAVPRFADFDLVAELRAYDLQLPVVICSTSNAALRHEATFHARLTKPLCAFAVRDTATRILLARSA
jgi:DNA-binding NtrC family response regulator